MPHVPEQLIPPRMEVQLNQIEPTPLIQIMSHMGRKHPDMKFKRVEKIVKYDDRLEFSLRYDSR